MAVQISGNDITVPRDGSFTRNVTIGGTLTYEDVTNIDSVGLVTARTGIEIGARPGVAASISVDGNMIVSGISTFNSRVLLGTTTEGHAEGDDLTIATSGVTGITIRSGTSSAGNIFFSDATSGSAERQGIIRYDHADDAMKCNVNNAERLRIDSSGRLLIGLTASQTTDSNAHSKLQVATSAGPNIGLGNNSTDINSGGRLGIINFNSNHGGTYHEVATIASRADADHASDSKASRLEFYTTASGATSGTERLRITSAGRLGVGDDSPDTALHVKSADNVLATFESTDADSLIEFKDNGTSDTILLGALGGDDLLFRCDAGNMVFHVADNNEKLRLDSSGRLLLGTTTEGHSAADELTIASTGTGGITIRTGTSSEGNIYFSDGTSSDAEYRGAITYNQNDDMFTLMTSATERFRIASTGALTSTAATNGQIIHQFKNTDTTSSSSAHTVEHHFNFNRSGGGMNSSAARIIAGKEGEWVGGASNQDGYLAFHTMLNESSVEKMRILSSGNMYLGDSVSGSGLGNSRGFIFETSGTQQIVTTSTSGKNVMEFGNPNGNVGRITTSGSSTTYYNSSDYRLKENATTISDGITRLKTLIPRRFSWKVDSTNTLVDGFFAHEVTAVPEAISGVKDEVHTEDNPVKGISKGDPLYQMIDQSKLVPLLTAALQEEIAKRESLEARIAALEG